MKTALAVFAKTPGLSPVKTRLASDLGKECAEAFYKASVKAVEEVMQQVRCLSGMTVEPYWAIAEKAGTGMAVWSSFPAVWTGEGNLGNRLFNVSARRLENYGQVILIGTDSPQIDAALILEAVEELAGDPDECVIGPCMDGGFYLFGSTFPIPESIWTGVTYSRGDTLEQLTQKLSEAGIKYSFLPDLGDIDYVDDLRYLLEYLSARGDKNLPAQQNLHDWLQKIKEDGNSKRGRFLT